MNLTDLSDLVRVQILNIWPNSWNCRTWLYIDQVALRSHRYAPGASRGALPLRGYKELKKSLTFCQSLYVLLTRARCNALVLVPSTMRGNNAISTNQFGTPRPSPTSGKLPTGLGIRLDLTQIIVRLCGHLPSGMA
jgi:hypothetical protein